MRFTIQEMLAEVELLAKQDLANGNRNKILGAIALELRAMLPGAAVQAVASLERRLEVVQRRREEDRPITEVVPAVQSALAGVGEEVSGKWPLIRQALARRALSRDEEVKVVARAIWDSFGGDCSAGDCHWGQDVERCHCQQTSADLAMLAVEALDKARLEAAGGA